MTYPVRVQITKRVDHVLAEPTLFKPSDFRSERFVSEIHLTWSWVDGEWRRSRVVYVSSLPKKDGTPSARWTTETAIGLRTEEALFAAFPEAATPPAEQVTVTITEGVPQ